MRQERQDKQQATTQVRKTAEAWAPLRSLNPGTQEKGPPLLPRRRSPRQPSGEGYSGAAYSAFRFESAEVGPTYKESSVKRHLNENSLGEIAFRTQLSLERSCHHRVRSTPLVSRPPSPTALWHLEAQGCCLPPAALLLCVWKPECMTELQPERPVRNGTEFGRRQ